MPFNWKALVNLAHDLERHAAQVADPEAHFRSAVSRAYFGAFGHACKYAKDFLEFEARELVEDHGRLRAHLKRKRRKGDADRLEQLRQWRNEADYLNDLPWSDLAATVATAINRAETVIASLIPPER